jgi:O-antigen/teichoic acid export membrane protein
MTDFIGKVKRSSIYTLIGSAWARAAVFIVTWLLIKKLSPEEYGIYNLLLATTAYLSVVSSLGLVHAFRRYLPEFFQRKEYSQFLWTVKFGQKFQATFAILSILVIVLLFDKIGPFFQIGDYFNHFLIFAIGTVFLFQAYLLEHVLEAMFLHKYVLYTHIIHSLIRLLFLCIIFYLGYGILQVFIIDSIANIALFGLCTLFYRLNAVHKVGPEGQHQHFSKTHVLKRVFRYSGFSVFNEIGKNFLDISTDLFVIAHYLGPSALGNYAFAARIGAMIEPLMPTRMLATVVEPVFFARYAQSGDKKELDRMFRFLSKLNAFLVFPVFTLVAIFGEEIIQYVFDRKYLDAYSVMVVLFIYFMPLAFPVALPLKAVEKPEMVLIGKFSSIYNLIMDIVLVQFWGIVGVAIATSSSIILKKIFEYAMSRKYAGITFPWGSILKVSLNCLVVGALGIWAKQFVHDIFSLVMVCLLTVPVYLGLSYISKIFLEEERNLMNKLIGRPVFTSDRRMVPENLARSITNKTVRQSLSNFDLDKLGH